jgi:V/A-type H+-transporting ATPase subunit I
VFDLLGTVPGYREYDISFFFLLFFTVFFAMIIGDGGYGAVLLAGSVFFSIKSKKKSGKISDGLILLNLLSFATIVWGAITGTWFGYAPIAETEPFSWFVIPEMYSFNPRSAEFIQFICFVIGTVHLTISHLWNFFDQIKKHPRIKAFAQLGWLSMLLGLYYLVLNLVLSPEKYPLPDFSPWLIGGGLVFIIVFSEQEGNFFKGILRGAAGIITTLLDGIGAFSDIISYIRLFAVGLASVEIAKSFNDMASGFGTGVGAAAAAVAVLFLGHSLNLAMGALSVIVHGVRLNMLEFSGHLGMEWTGIPYDPFREKEEEQNSSLDREKVETA